MKVFALKEYLEEARELVNRALEQALPPEGEFPQKLHQAMRYSLLGAGKRLRPILCLAACEAAGGERSAALGAACALEMIHAHSLIHDDLPCMDNDDFRRGRPTCHKVFGEATALLAGDALIYSAFAAAAASPLPPGRVRKILARLAEASGSRGMCGGQQADLDAAGKAGDPETLKRVHRLKTGALIEASVLCGGIAAGARNRVLATLGEYGRKAGLAFQVGDDILDVTGDLERLGKTPGKDAAAGKLTYPALYGLAESRRILAETAAAAAGALDELGEKAASLRAIAAHIAARDR